MTIYINEKYKFVYFMIPKNASSTIRHFILQNLFDNPNLKYNWEQISDFGNFCSRNKSLSQCKDYFWFIFFRNPINRVVSTYNDKVLSIVGDQVYDGLYNPRMSLEKFIDFVIKTPDLVIDRHIKSQTFGNVEKLLNQNRFDFIGSVENFEHDMRKVKILLNLKYEPLKLRKTIRRNVHTNLKEKLYKRYENDFILFKKIGLNYIV